MIKFTVEPEGRCSCWIDSLWKVDHVMVVYVLEKWNVIVKLLMEHLNFWEKDCLKFRILTGSTCVTCVVWFVLLIYETTLSNVERVRIRQIYLRCVCRMLVNCCSKNWWLCKLHREWCAYRRPKWPKRPRINSSPISKNLEDNFSTCLSPLVSLFAYFFGSDLEFATELQTADFKSSTFSYLIWFVLDRYVGSHLAKAPRGGRYEMRQK